MFEFNVVPNIFYFDTFADFNREFVLNDKDMILTNEWLYDPFIKPLKTDTKVIFQEKYGAGEPSDIMIDLICEEMSKYRFERLFAIGGGTIIDICKILSLEPAEKSVQLFTGQAPVIKKRELIAVPTTCGTGSEVTNVAIAELKSLGIKKGIASEHTYADHAVIIPESLSLLPDRVFATSSIDAFIHATEAYVSPKASPFTEMYSLKAIEMIINGYKKIAASGGNDKESRAPFLKDFAIASDYAGIAFGNAGVGAVHALSYSIGGAFHVPHGEANYQFFTEVFKLYMKKNPHGKIKKINRILAEYMECSEENVYEELEKLLDKLIAKKPLREYGMQISDIDRFTRSTIEEQQRLLVNNYVELTDDEIRGIFANLY